MSSCLIASSFPCSLPTNVSDCSTVEAA
eukprot:COSAG05_NODE_25715_length_194_cov_44.852632_1_plen_27_part_01